MSTLAEALAPKSDQLNADDLIAGPRVIKFTKARISKEDRQTKIVLNYEGDNGKPWKPCKTMGRAMVMAWGITDEAQLVGKSVRVYRDPEVKFGDQGAVGGIRISHMSDIAKPAIIKLTVSQGKKSLFTFHPLVTETARQADPNAAANWANEHMAQLGRIDALEDLEAYIAKNAKTVARLKESRADLHDKVLNAYDVRRDMLTPTEGRADQDMGEGFIGADEDEAPFV